jgi:putative flippase GtrA
MMSSKNDYWLVTIIGFLVGWLILLPATNLLDTKFSFFIIAGSVFGFTILAPLIFFIFKKISLFFRIAEQLGKFAAVGTLGTFLDLGILNALIILTGAAAGWRFTLFKTISFFIASLNNYFWHKFWTFESNSAVSLKDYGKFISVMLISAAVNVIVASFFVNIVGTPQGFPVKVWANISAGIAVIFSIAWSFSGLKFFVFEKRI